MQGIGEGMWDGRVELAIWEERSGGEAETFELKAPGENLSIRS